MARAARSSAKSAAWATLSVMSDAALEMPEARLSAGRKLWVVTRLLLRSVRELFPWTPLGMSLGLLSLLALRVFAYAELDLVWLVLGYAAVGLCIAAPLCVLPCALYVHGKAKRAASGDTLQAETGTALDTGFALPSLRFFPLVQVRWEWVLPHGARVGTQAERGLLHERVVLAERGEHAVIARRVFVEDPFGLARMALRVRKERSVRVLPRLGALSHVPSLVSLAAGDDLPHPMGLEDGDRLELSRYTAGDPARFIHWKVFGRTRKLMVRRPERAVSISRRAAAFFVASEGDDATAAVARLALERRLLGREWVFGTDQALSGSSRVDEAVTSLVRSVSAREHAGKGLRSFLSQVDKRGPASVIVFVPTRPGPWMTAVIEATRNRRVRAVLAVDAVARPAPRSLLSRMFAFAAEEQGSSAVLLEQVVTALSRAGIAVTLFDRTTGRVLSEQHRRALAMASLHEPSRVSHAQGATR
jgi:uncharacterized protein (DUF58 family)